MVMAAIQDSIQTKGGLWGYYRQPNGWITTAITTTLERMSYIQEGWTPLPQYGLVELTTKWSADHPLEALFIAGGAKELPIDQIIESGMHLNLPLIPVCGRRLNQYHKLHGPGCWIGAQPVRFPQLEGMDVPAWPCRHCTEIRATEEGRKNHETVAHKEDKGDIKMAEALAAALNKREAPSLVDMAETIAAALDRRAGSGAPVSLTDEVAALRAEVAYLKLQAPRRKRVEDGREPS